MKHQFYCFPILLLLSVPALATPQGDWLKTACNDYGGIKEFHFSYDDKYVTGMVVCKDNTKFVTNVKRNAALEAKKKAAVQSAITILLLD